MWISTSENGYGGIEQFISARSADLDKAAVPIHGYLAMSRTAAMR